MCADVGASIVLAVSVALLLLDARAFVTLALPGDVGRIGMVLLLCAGWITPPLVLRPLITAANRQRLAMLAQRPAPIVQLEREVLGNKLPST